MEMKKRRENLERKSSGRWKCEKKMKEFWD